MQKPSFFTVVMGAICLVFGALLTAEGIWLAAVGGTPAYLIGGIGYIVVGGLLVARRPVAFWAHLLLFATVLIWSFIETGFNQWTVFTALPRLDIPLLIALLLMLPWAWRGRASAALPGLTSGVVSIFLIVAGIGVMLSMPWIHHPDGPIANHGTTGDGVTLPATDAAPGDWPSWGRTKGQSRFSPLDQINTHNVDQLKVAWRYQSGDMNHAQDESPHWGAESTPIKIGNTAYTCTPNAWVVALNATTGQQKWKFKPRGIDDSVNNFANCRGVAYYKAPAGYSALDGSQTCAERIIAPTMGPYVVALDAKTGQKCHNFGHDGMIDLTQNIGPMRRGTLVQTSAPLVMNGRIYTGGNVFDNWYWGEPSGVVRAWDAVTGKLLWHWDLGKPDPTAPLADGEIYTPSTPNVWGRISGDPDNDVVYLPTGNATPDYYGKHRPKYDDEYSGSIVALNAETGQEIWHFQEAHTDLWDFDIPIGPSLVQWPNGHGGHVPALVSTNKRGQLFVLNRLSGQPIKRVEEKPVPGAPANAAYDQGWLSKTQPYSTQEPQFPKHKLTADDMWGATPFDQMWCRSRYQQSYYKGDFTPPTPQGSIMYPTFDGTSDWYGASFGPQGQMNIVANYLPFIGTLIPRDKADHPPAIQHWTGQGLPPEGYGGGTWKPQYGLPYAIHLHPFLSPIKMPCNAPPWATLNQIDLASGKTVWSTPLGNSRHTAPFGFKQNLALPSSVPDLGGGVMTAGGVTFIAGTADDKLRAYDTTTGQVLWSTYLPAGGQANPSVYRGMDGREYVVITAGGHQPLGTKRGDYTVAFALPADKSNNTGAH